MRLGTFVLAVAVLCAVFWVVHHHSDTADGWCVTAPARVCVDWPTTTSGRRR